MLRSQIQKPACCASFAALVAIVPTGAARANTTTIVSDFSGARREEA